MKESIEFQIRIAKPGEFQAVGELMVRTYSALDGLPKTMGQITLIEAADLYPNLLNKIPFGLGGNPI